MHRPRESGRRKIVEHSIVVSGIVDIDSRDYQDVGTRRCPGTALLRGSLVIKGDKRQREPGWVVVSSERYTLRHPSLMTQATLGHSSLTRVAKLLEDSKSLMTGLLVCRFRLVQSCLLDLDSCP